MKNKSNKQVEVQLQDRGTGAAGGVVSQAACLTEAANLVGAAGTTTSETENRAVSEEQQVEHEEQGQQEQEQQAGVNKCHTSRSETRSSP